MAGRHASDILPRNADVSCVDRAGYMMVAKRRMIRDRPGMRYIHREDRAGIEPWLMAMTYETANGDRSIVREAFG